MAIQRAPWLALSAAWLASATSALAAPPVPEIASVQIGVKDPKATEQNAWLLVDVAPGQKLASTLTYAIEADAPITLNDQGLEGDVTRGDGVYTALVDFDLEAWEARQQAYEDRLHATDEWIHYAFDGRTQILAESYEPGKPAVLEVPKGLDAAFMLQVTPAPPRAATISADRSLVITDLSVVADPTRTFDPCNTDGLGGNGDPDGPWTFKTLLSQMAHPAHTGISPEDFVRDWLRTFETNQSVNGQTVYSRPQAAPTISTPWPKVSGDLDLDEAPFRLLAIVNRLDLRGNPGYGAGAAGELRFVFGLLGPSCMPLPMTVIFEYQVPADDCGDTMAYAQAWEALDSGNGPLPSAQYNGDLQAITDPVTAAGAAPDRPNRSALGQVRTNEVALNPFGFWQLREYGIAATGPDAGHLVLQPLGRTPLNTGNSTALTNWVDDERVQICLERHVVPDTYGFNPFRAADIQTAMAADHYSMNVLNPALTCSTDELRFRMSVNTCGACHSNETKDVGLGDLPFVHIDPETTAGNPAALSQFLTGTPAPGVEDPTVPGTYRIFHDLARRATDLDDLLVNGCFGEVGHQPVLSTH